jgi:hypothetical protein
VITEYVDHGDELRQALYDYAQTHFAWPVVARRLRRELESLGASRGGDEP